jgi:hypothetical protein
VLTTRSLHTCTHSPSARLCLGTGTAQDAFAPSALLSTSPSSISSSAAPPSLSVLRPPSIAAALTLSSSGSVVSSDLATSDEEVVVVDLGVQAEEAWSDVAAGGAPTNTV